MILEGHYKVLFFDRCISQFSIFTGPSLKITPSGWSFPVQILSLLLLLLLLIFGVKRSTYTQQNWLICKITLNLFKGLYWLDSELIHLYIFAYIFVCCKLGFKSLLMHNVALCIAVDVWLCVNRVSMWQKDDKERNIWVSAVKCLRTLNIYFSLIFRVW